MFKAGASTEEGRKEYSPYHSMCDYMGKSKSKYKNHIHVWILRVADFGYGHDFYCFHAVLFLQPLVGYNWILQAQSFQWKYNFEKAGLKVSSVYTAQRYDLYAFTFLWNKM
jgi:hypothetical protein